MDQVESVDEVERKAGEVERSKATLWVACGGLLIAALQAVFFGYQLSLMRVNAKDTSDAARAAKEAADIATYETRPWMAFGQVQVVHNHGHKRERLSTTFTLHWQNTGRSPAYNARVSYFLQNAKLAAAAPEYQPTFDGPPSDLLGAMTIQSPMTVDAELIDALKRKATRLYIFGAVQYEWKARPGELFVTEVGMEVVVIGVDPAGYEMFQYIDLGSKVV